MPSVKIPISKWRALLAHLIAPLKSASIITPAYKSPSSSTITNSCLVDLVSDKTYGFCSPSVCPPPIDSWLHLHSGAADAQTSISCLETNHIAPQISNSSLLSNDVNQLLCKCLDRPDDLDMQASTLDALCTLCSAMPAAADMCVDSGGVEIVLRMLNSTPQPRHGAPLIPTPSVEVEKNEKALHLLYLITSSSEAGCAAALRQTTSIIMRLGKKILRVSEACTFSAIAILCTLCSDSEATLFCKAVSETAIPSKLVVVLQVASKDSTKERAGRLLRLLAEQGKEHKST